MRMRAKLAVCYTCLPLAVAVMLATLSLTRSEFIKLENKIVAMRPAPTRELILSQCRPASSKLCAAANGSVTSQAALGVNPLPISTPSGEQANAIPLIVAAPIEAATRIQIPSKLAITTFVPIRKKVLSDGAGLVFVDEAQGVVAFDALNGHVRWRAPGLKLLSVETTGGDLYHSTAPGGVGDWATPGVNPSSGVLMLGSSKEPSLSMALDAKTGHPLWHTSAQFVGAFGSNGLFFQKANESGRGALSVRSLHGGTVLWNTPPEPIFDARALLAAPTTILVTGDSQGAITTMNTLALDWRLGSLRWSAIHTGGVLLIKRNRVYLQVVFPLPSTDAYRPFVLSIINGYSGDASVPSRQYIYAPDPAQNFLSRPNGFWAVQADRAYVGSKWVWMRIFGKWYRYDSDTEPAHDRPVRIDGMRDVIIWQSDATMLLLTKNGIGFAHVGPARVVVRPLRLGTRVTLLGFAGPLTYAQNGRSLFVLDLARDRVVAHYALPCSTVTQAIRWKKHLSVLCAPDSTGISKFAYYSE